MEYREEGGRLVAGPELPGAHQNHTTRGEWVGFFIGLSIAFLAGASVGFTVAADDPSLAEFSEERVLAGCIPIVRSPHLGARDDVQRLVDADLAEISAYSDSRNIQSAVVDLPEGAVRAVFPDAESIGFVSFERCLNGAG